MKDKKVQEVTQANEVGYVQVRPTQAWPFAFCTWSALGSCGDQEKLESQCPKGTTASESVVTWNYLLSVTAHASFLRNARSSNFQMWNIVPMQYWQPFQICKLHNQNMSSGHSSEAWGIVVAWRVEKTEKKWIRQIARSRYPILPFHKQPKSWVVQRGNLPDFQNQLYTRAQH